jgi:hypothetical protein
MKLKYKASIFYDVRVNGEKSHRRGPTTNSG